MSVKAVVFDYGKVISFPPSPQARRELARMAGISEETLEELDRKHRGEYDRGAFDGKAYFGFLLSQAGVFPGDSALEEIARLDAQSWKRINPGTTALMGDVKKRGFTLGILSNMPHDFLAWARKNIPVFAEADTAVFSCEVNAIKPEPLIYEILRGRLGCEFREIVFFDDMPDNVARARELGIQAFLWNGSEEARGELEKLDGAFA
jgi:putative hydrolase of the HAD superfamily